MASKQEKRKSLTIKVEELDFDTLLIAPPPSYMTPELAAKAKTHTDKLKEINLVQADLISEMDNLTSKDYQTACPRCSKSIGKLDDYINAVGRRFHPGCFSCDHCNKVLGKNPYIEHSGKVYCPEDHAKLFGAKCAFCGKLITGKIVFALGSAWCSDHLRCDICNKVLEPGFVEKDGKAYCKADFTKIFSAPCGGCGKIVEGEYLNTLGKRWHPSCYNCQVCHKPFVEKAYPFNNMPYCEYHFHEKNNTLCASCGKPVNGQCVRALDRAYHPTCFKCATCHVQLSGEFFPVKGKAYCEKHGIEV